jgi:hypothetical protein
MDKIKEVHMQTLTIGELKTGFSEVLKKIRSGQKIVISYGKKREKVAKCQKSEIGNQRSVSEIGDQRPEVRYGNKTDKVCKGLESI